MVLRIERRERIVLAGMGFFGDPFRTASAWDEENEIGSLWRRFTGFLLESPGAIPGMGPQEKAWYELHIWGPEADRSGRYEVFVGLELGAPGNLPGLPIRVSAKVLPAAEYAIAVVNGRELASDWHDTLYGKIQSDFGRMADRSLCVDYYDERFKGMDRLAESELEVWVPLLPPAGE